MSEKTFKEHAAQDVNWDDLAAFLAVARHEGLSAAAPAIGSSAPTLGRHMRALERRLGRELFVRHSHGYSLTEAGLQLCLDLAPAEQAVARATRILDAGVLPVVKLAAGTWTMLELAGNHARLAGDPQDLRLRLLQGEDILSIPRRETVIGFRHQRPTEQGLAARKLRVMEFAVYANGTAPDEWISVIGKTPSARWLAQHVGGNVSVETTSPRLALDLAATGVGKVVLPTSIGDLQPELARQGPVIDELTHEQWLVTHDEDRNLPEVRRALDRIGLLFR